MNVNCLSFHLLLNLNGLGKPKHRPAANEDGEAWILEYWSKEVWTELPFYPQVVLPAISSPGTQLDYKGPLHGSGGERQ